MLYVYACPRGCTVSERRSIADRNAEALCDPHAAPLRRALDVELRTITIAPVPLSFFTQWSDVYPDVSPREMARRKDLDRYDPTMPVSRKGSARRDLPRVDLRRHVPASDAEALALGTRRRLEPIEGDFANL